MLRLIEWNHVELVSVLFLLPNRIYSQALPEVLSTE